MSTETIYRVDVHHNVRIPTESAGVTLSGDLYLPADAPEPLGAIVTVLPYRKDALGGRGGWDTNHWFASRGLAVLLVDFRGTGGSDGDARAPFDPHESDDAIASIDWLRSQPWSNGRVGMWGISYGAVMSLRTAARRPQGLIAIAPFMGMTDPERDFVHPGGDRGALASIGMWGLSTLLDVLIPPTDETDSEDEERWRQRVEQFTPWAIDLWNTPPGDPRWRERAIDLEAVEVPTLCVAGWHDLFVDGSLRAFERIQGPKQLIVGPWMHTFPHESPFNAFDIRPALLAWWRKWLVDEPTAASTSSATLFVEGEGWRQFREWPPVDRANWEIHIAGPGEIPGRGTEDVGALSGLVAIPTTGFGLPLDQRADDMRGVIAERTVTEDMRIVGRPIARIAGLPLGARIVVKIAHVDAHGVSKLLSYGVRSALDDDEIVRMTPMAARISAGDSVRVILSSSDFPRLWPSRGSSFESGTVDLPIAQENPRVDASLAPLPPAHLGGAGWRLTRSAPDRASIRIFHEGVVEAPGRAATLDIDIDVRATAEEGRGVLIEAEARTRIRYSSGKQIDVAAGLRASPDALQVHGSISCDGIAVLSRKWEAQ